MDSLVTVVHEQVAKTPDAIAVIFDNDRDVCPVSITYLEMWNRALSICNILERHGVQTETVGVCLEPCVNLPSVLLGILKTSSCFYPFGVDGLGFVQHSLQRLSVQHLIVDYTSLESLQPMLFQLSVQVLPSPDLQSLGLCLVKIDTNSAAAGNSHQPSLPWVPDLAYCITTSGTTGTPKIVRVPQACVVPNILDFRQEFKPVVGDIALLASPLTFDPSMIDIFVTLSSGASLLVIPSAVKMSADRLLTMITSRHKVSVLQMTPALLKRFDTTQLRNTLLGAQSCLRVLALGGEQFPCSSYFADSVHPANKTTVYNVYGVTEVSCWASLQRVRLPGGHFEEAVSVGQPLTGTSIKIVSEKGEDVMLGTGEIWIGGSQRVCLLNSEAADILNGDVVWRGTGDQGKVDENGCIFCLGRNDDQIKRNGKRLSLSTLQQVCLEVECVKNSKAVHHDERLYLFVVEKEDGDYSKRDVVKMVKSHLVQVLPAQYQPDIIRVVPDIPANKHGKVDVAALLRLMDSQDKDRDKYDPELETVDDWEHNLWQENVGYSSKEISSSDNFLLSGGDSLRAVRLAETVEGYMGQKVTGLLEVILTGTYEEFVSLIRKHISVSPARAGLKRKQGFQGGHGLKKLRTLGVTPHMLERTEDNDCNCVEEGQVHRMTSEEIQLLHSSPFLGEDCGAQDSDQSGITADVEVENTAHSGEDAGMDKVNAHRTSDEYSSALSVVSKQTCLLRHQATDSLNNTSGMVEDYTDHKQENLQDSGFPAETESDTKANKNSYSLSAQDDFVACVGRGGSLQGFRTGTSLDDGVLLCKRCSCRQGGSMDRRIRLNLQWQVNTGKCVDASPLVAVTRSGRRVAFIGSHSHRFFAVAMDTGTVLWSTQLGGRVEGSACLSACGQLLVVGCYDHHIYTLDAHSGDIVWKFLTGNTVKCTPVTNSLSGFTLCGSHDGHLMKLNCQKHQVFWRQDLGGGSVFASPAVSPDGSTVFVATLAGLVHAVRMSSGEIVWTTDLNKPVFSSLTMDRDQLYVGCVDGGLHCLDASSGRQKWVFWVEGPVFSSPSVTQNSVTETLILFGSHDSHLYCISQSGELRWQHKCLATVYASPFVFQLTDCLHDSSGCQDQSQDLEMGEEVLKYCRVASTLCMEQSNKNTVEYTSSTSRPCSETRASVQPLAAESLQGQEATLALSDSDVDSTSVRGTSSLTNSNSQNTESAQCFHAGTAGCGGLVACASSDGTVFIVDAESGVEKGSVKLPGDVFSSPVVVGDQLVVGCRNDYIYCYKLMYDRVQAADREHS